VQAAEHLVKSRIGMKAGVLRVVRYLDEETGVFVKCFCEPPYAILLIARDRQQELIATGF